MGQHAFVTAPSQVVRLRCDHPEMVNEGVFGIEPSWDIPITIWRAIAGFDIRYPCDDHDTLSFILGGGGVERRDGRFSGRSGCADADGFILYSGGGSRRYAARGDVRLCQMYFQTSLVQDIASKEFDRPTDGLELRDDRVFARDLELRRRVDRYLSRAVDSDRPPSRLEMDARAVLIGVHLLRHHTNRSGFGARSAGNLSPRRLATAVDFIEANLAEKLTLADLADAVGLSRYCFRGAFRRSTGMTPHRYLTARRMERAKRLLAGPAPLAEIALDCGYGSQQHFTNAFRQELGTTPGALRSAARR